MKGEKWTGGCQCGAVRYAFSVRPDNPCLCHCRMCQKQFGNAFGAFAGSHTENFRITRGTMAHFKSSDEALRGFCKDCGTPLTFERSSRPRISVSIGSLDRHSDMQPLVSYGAECMEPWLGTIANLPATTTGTGDDPALYVLIRETNLQHPDHDTEHWPTAGGR